ncbi:hypothetical protein [Gordonia otitidis]|uniref:hypothetical protein n=1 Tax=Gordonia otitidis TaxID=249058 RepID=UPI002353965D|nr:hypothetical protein [Gordonia otitidis]
MNTTERSEHTAPAEDTAGAKPVTETKTKTNAETKTETKTKTSTRTVITTGRLVGVGLAVVAVACAVLTGFLGFRYWDARATENSRESSLEAARDYATTMFGYDPVNVADHVQRSQRVVTGDAKAEYDRLIAKPLPNENDDFVEGVRKQRVVSQAVIQDAGVVTNTRDTSTVLIFMNQSVSRNGKDLVRVDPSRLTFSMVQHDGTWMIDKIEIITDDSFRSRIEQTSTPLAGAVPLPGPSSASPSPSDSSIVPTEPSAPPAG